MKIASPPYSWRLSPRRAVALQRALAARVSEGPCDDRLRLIAGLDAAYSREGHPCIAAAVLWDVRAQRVVEQTIAERKVVFPYIPGLLSFRETPTLLAALRKLRQTPDALMCDGHGRAHPRRFGIACHVGVICNLPAIGCAKSVLVGTHGRLPVRRGARVPLLDQNETIGSVLRTQTGVNPVFVSVGHRIDLATCERIVLACATRYRLPEPTRLADLLVAAAKRSWEAAEIVGEPGLHVSQPGWRGRTKRE